MTATRARYRCSSGGKSLKIGNVNTSQQFLDILFHRTLRVPDNVETAYLPESLGTFPLYKVRDYTSRLPSDVVSKGGLFLHMHQKEAMWIQFRAQTPFMIKLYCGGVNITSAKHCSKDADEIFFQMALGRMMGNRYHHIATKPRVVRQFVAMTMSEGYSVEAQLTGEECVGGLQFEITPSVISVPEVPESYIDSMLKRIWQFGVDGKFPVLIKSLTSRTMIVFYGSTDTISDLKEQYSERESIPIDQQRVVFQNKQLEDDWTPQECNIEKESFVHVFPTLREGGLRSEMGIAAGGIIEQTIDQDTYEPYIWDQVTLTIPVHILNTATFRAATGHNPPLDPNHAYASPDIGHPFFDTYEEPSAVHGDFNAVKGVNEIEQKRGLADGGEPSVKPRVGEIARGGQAIPTAAQVDLSQLVDDPDGLLSLAGPLCGFRTLSSLARELESLTLGSPNESKPKSGF